MSIDINKIKKAATAAVEGAGNQPNMHDAKASTYTPPAAGKALARLVGVVEVGEHEITGGPKNIPKIKDRIRYIFELFGKKYPRQVAEDGTEYPVRLSRTITNSRHEKSTQYEWVSNMDPEKKYSHPVQMIGDSFIVDIEHKEFPDGVRAFIKSVGPAEKEDLDSGEKTPIVAPEPLSELMIFLWSNPSLEMWNSLYIPGEFDNRSKNVLQEMVTTALNFDGSPAAVMLNKALENGEVVKGLNWEEGGESGEGAKAPAPAPAAAPAPAVSTGLDDDDDGVTETTTADTSKPATKKETKVKKEAETEGEPEDAAPTTRKPAMNAKAADRLAALIGKK